MRPNDDLGVKLVWRFRNQRIGAGLSRGIVNEASGNARRLNFRESFRAAFGVDVFVNDLLRGLREARAAASTEENKPKPQLKLSRGRDFH